jgi:GTP cyclohydrolase I
VLALLKASQIETVIVSNHSCMRMSACSAQFSLLVFSQLHGLWPLLLLSVFVKITSEIGS